MDFLMISLIAGLAVGVAARWVRLAPTLESAFIIGSWLIFLLPLEGFLLSTLVSVVFLSSAVLVARAFRPIRQG